MTPLTLIVPMAATHMMYERAYGQHILERLNAPIALDALLEGSQTRTGNTKAYEVVFKRKRPVPGRADASGKGGGEHTGAPRMRDTIMLNTRVYDPMVRNVAIDQHRLYIVKNNIISKGYVDAAKIPKQDNNFSPSFRLKFEASDGREGLPVKAVSYNVADHKSSEVKRNLSFRTPTTPATVENLLLSPAVGNCIRRPIWAEGGLVSAPPALTFENEYFRKYDSIMPVHGRNGDGFTTRCRKLCSDQMSADFSALVNFNISSTCLFFTDPKREKEPPSNTSPPGTDGVAPSRHAQAHGSLLDPYCFIVTCAPESVVVLVNETPSIGLLKIHVILEKVIQAWIDQEKEEALACSVAEPRLAKPPTALAPPGLAPMTATQHMERIHKILKSPKLLDVVRQNERMLSEAASQYTNDDQDKFSKHPGLIAMNVHSVGVSDTTSDVTIKGQSLMATRDPSTISLIVSKNGTLHRTGQPASCRHHGVPCDGHCPYEFVRASPDFKIADAAVLDIGFPSHFLVFNLEAFSRAVAEKNPSLLEMEWELDPLPRHVDDDTPPPHQFDVQSHIRTGHTCVFAAKMKVDVWEKMQSPAVFGHTITGQEIDGGEREFVRDYAGTTSSVLIFSA